jgi:hypothetical protein
MAIIEAHDWQVKPGGGEKIVALIQAALAQWQPPQGLPTYLSSRTYSPTLTRFVLLLEWNNRAEQERWYEAFEASPAGQEYWRKVVEFPVSTRDEYWTPLEPPAGFAATGEARAGIVEAHDWQVKPGGGEKIFALQQATLAQWQPLAGTPQPLSMRAYSPSWTRLVGLVEWKSFADMEQWYAAFGASPAGQEYFLKMYELVVSAYTGGWEFWTPLETWIGNQAP